MNLLIPFLSNKSPVHQLVVLIFLTIGSALIVNIAGLLMAIPFTGSEIIHNPSMLSDTATQSGLVLMKYLQIVSQVAVFLVPALLFSRLVSSSPFHFLNLDTGPGGKQVLVSIALLAISAPALAWLQKLNAGISLPQSMSGIETWMRSSEAEATRITDAFLNVKSLPGLLGNLIIMAVLPAIAEEFFFRGVLQKIFAVWFKNIHAAIFTTALLFSAIHLQFYGFFPRLILGIWLGYLLHWSGSIWLPVMIHFLNNGTTVVMAFLWFNGMSELNPVVYANSQGLFFIIQSLVLSSLLIVLQIKLSIKRQTSE